MIHFQYKTNTTTQGLPQHRDPFMITSAIISMFKLFPQLLAREDVTIVHDVVYNYLG